MVTMIGRNRKDFEEKKLKGNVSKNTIEPGTEVFQMRQMKMIMRRNDDDLILTIKSFYDDDEDSKGEDTLRG